MYVCVSKGGRGISLLRCNCDHINNFRGLCFASMFLLSIFLAQSAEYNSENKSA